MLVLELWWQYTAGIAVAAAVTITVISLVYVSRHRSDPDPTATSTDTEEQVSILRESWNCPPAPEVRPGNIKRVQEGHDQNVHSTLTVCVIDSGVVIGGNDAPFQQQSTEQEVREPIKTKNSFDSFIRDYVIPTFCLQRRDKQFAVLFLSKYDEYNIHKTQFDPHCIVCPRALVYPNESHFPGYVCRHLGNYIVARPDRNKKKTRHAEQFLLDKQGILISNYTQHHGKPQLIVLYSWLMPCFNCTTRIVKAFKNCRTKVIVVYTSHSQAKTMKWDKRRLEQANITLIRVKYNDPLPPIY